MELPAGSREAWRERRRAMEAHGVRSGPKGTHSRSHWQIFKLLIKLFGAILKLTGLYQRGRRNALDIRLTRFELDFPDLPAGFDGFTILQLTDLHVDALPGAMAAARTHAAELEVDLCVLTGDYRYRVHGAHEQIMPGMRELVAAVRARHGICAVMGNHDCADMVPAFEALGITMLINESLSFERGGEAIHLTGTDDVHYFYSEAASTALKASPAGFKIALIHSPELADVAAECGFQLYLTGHTHGGQICLPGGRPILTHLSRHRRYARGMWRHDRMQGYTSTGVGISALPVRYNNRGEVVLITLNRAAKAE